MSIDQVVESRSVFLSLEKDHFRIKNPSSAYWFTFTAKSLRTGRKNKWIFENQDLHIDELEFYIYEDGKWQSLPAGFQLPFSAREYEHKNFAFDIPLDSTERTFYVKVKSSKPNVILFKIRSSKFFTNYALNEYFILGLFYGVLVIMAVYNFILWITIREKLYLYYVLYVLACAIITLGEDGLGFQYLWPDFPYLNNLLFNSGPVLLVLTFTIYSRKFLELRTNNRFLDNLLLFIAAVYLLLSLTASAFFSLSSFPFYIIPFSAIYIAAVVVFIKGYKPSRFFLLGYSFMFFSIILLLLRMTGLYNLNNFVVLYSFNIGLLFEIVILSFALGDRFRIEKRQKEFAMLENQEAQRKVIEQLRINEEMKDRINRELEEKVAERTFELKEKNDELEIACEELEYQAEEIQRMNDLLSEENQKLKVNLGNLEKARVLQQDVGFQEFSEIFPDKESCYKHLAEVKWAKGYSCSKCGNTKYYEFSELYARRCTKCRYVESATANTIFEKVKFPINKAFYLVFLVYSNKGKLTAAEISQILSLREKTCLKFKKKVEEAISSKPKKSTTADGWSELIIE